MTREYGKRCIVCKKEIQRKGAHKRLKRKGYLTCSKECSKVLERIRHYLDNLHNQKQQNEKK